MAKKRRLPLTARVRDGLRTLAGHADAGSSADILGFEYDRLSADGKRTWDAVEAAIRWVDSLPSDEEDES